MTGSSTSGPSSTNLSVDPSPLVVALVLGPLMEKTLRQTLFMARGEWTEIVSRPLTLALLLVGALALAGPPLVRLARRRPAGPRLSGVSR